MDDLVCVTVCHCTEHRMNIVTSQLFTVMMSFLHLQPIQKLPASVVIGHKYSIVVYSNLQLEKDLQSSNIKNIFSRVSKYSWRRRIFGWSKSAIICISFLSFEILFGCNFLLDRVFRAYLIFVVLWMQILTDPLIPEPKTGKLSIS